MTSYLNTLAHLSTAHSSTAQSSSSQSSSLHSPTHSSNHSFRTRRLSSTFSQILYATYFAVKWKKFYLFQVKQWPLTFALLYCMTNFELCQTSFFNISLTRKQTWFPIRFCKYIEKVIWSVWASVWSAQLSYKCHAWPLTCILFLQAHVRALQSNWSVAITDKLCCTFTPSLKSFCLFYVF